MFVAGFSSLKYLDHLENYHNLNGKCISEKVTEVGVVNYFSVTGKLSETYHVNGHLVNV